MRKFTRLVDEGLTTAELCGLYCMEENEIYKLRQGLEAQRQVTSVLKYTPDLQPTHFREIARAPEEARPIIAEQAARENWTVKQVIEAVRETKAPPPAPKLPDGTYRAIVIDPPWPIEKIQRDVRPNQQDMDYPMMSIDEIAGLPVPSLADQNGCHIYLWTTHKHLPSALSIFDRWGVRYQCLMTWVKNVGITPFSWMYSTEHVLFGRIGSLQLDRMGLRLDFAAKVREHSRKPDEFYELVRQVSPEARLEMFAREPREGFEAWGNEVERFATVAVR